MVGECRKAISSYYKQWHLLITEEMELYIETLTGTAFELRVSPFETIMSVKGKIQRLEGRNRFINHFLLQRCIISPNFDASVCYSGSMISQLILVT